MEENKNLAESLVGRIKRGEIKMRPRLYFVLKSFIYFLVTAFFVVLALFFTTFVFYVLKINGFIRMSGFGLKGMRDLFLSLPLTLLVLTVLFFLTAGAMLLRYPVSYRKPLVYLVGFLLLVLSLGTVFFAQATGLRREIFYIAEKAEIPIIKNLYNEYKSIAPKNVEIGTVTFVSSGSFGLKTSKEEIRVVLGPNTSIYADGGIKEGSYVIVHGNRNGNIVGAFVVEMIIQN